MVATRKKSSNAPGTLRPRGCGPNALLLHLQHRGIPATLENYLAHAGLTEDDLKDAEIRESLPPVIRKLLRAEQSRSETST